ncbi:uncharacterized protein TNCV_2273471 [Trichonephila clavipes]|nr:uncharacterized protein TNCV_2273471 [Trichonephila clavipes]
MRSIGKGAEAGRMFCGVMNLPQPPTRFSPYAVAVNGHGRSVVTSLNGVVTVTSIDTGKVIDVDILSKYCACKNLPFHEKDCKRTTLDLVERWKSSGENRLTEHEIDNLQSYYGSAIRRNHSSVQNMRQAIWAIFLHKLSTDEYPQHGFCPIGKDSWCGFKKAETSCKSYKHKNSLPFAVVEAMRPIFRDLSHPDLLKKCLHGKTQNPNEKVFIMSFGHVFPKQHLYRLKHFHLVFMMLFVPLLMVMYRN